MSSQALPEDQLRRFLRRTRRNQGHVAPPPLGALINEALELCLRLVQCDAAAVFLDDPVRRLKDNRSVLTLIARAGTIERELGSKLEITSDQGVLSQVYHSGELRVEVSIEGTPITAVSPIRLERTVCGVFEVKRLSSEEPFAERELELVGLFSRYVSRATLNAIDLLKHNELAQVDHLTGVRNIRGFDPHLRTEIEKAEALGTDLVVLFIDVDRLKNVNDRFGHPTGSEVLRRTGRAIKKGLRGLATVFRFGGDEFVAVCPRLSLAEGAKLAERVRVKVFEESAESPEESEVPAISVSIGVASLRESLPERKGDPDSDRASRLLIAADRALYQAKHAGRARVRSAPPLGER